MLARQWVRRSQPLAVAGPRPVLDAVRPWPGPDDPVQLVHLEPGATLEREGYRVRALAATHGVPTVLFDVAGPDGARLLYATDTGPLPDGTVEATRDAAYDLVLLEENIRPGARARDRTPGPHDVPRPAGPAARRRRGHAGDRRRRRAPGPPQAAGRRAGPRALAGHGARLVADGDCLTARCAAAAPGA